jgi:serine/threonine protein kinase
MEGLAKASVIDEAVLLNGLVHRGLPSYENSIEYGNARYTLRRYIEGEPLNEYITRIKTVDPRQVVDALISLCDTLEFLHTRENPIIHRDIKPSNIIINPETNDVVLIDFGISRKYTDEAGTDTTNLGTRRYAPPEQYGYAQTDARADIYSLGVVMRYWLSGSADLRGKIPCKPLERIVRKCTAFAPDARYKSAAALKRALLGYKWHKNENFAVCVGCFLMVCIVMAILLFLRLPKESYLPTPVPEPPIIQASVYTPTPEPEPFDAYTHIAFSTPEGYNDNDYQKMVGFFLQGDNLAIIEAMIKGFNLIAPQTWITRDGALIFKEYWVGVQWDAVKGESEYRVTHIHLDEFGLSGSLDVSGFVGLQTLSVAGNHLTALNVRGAADLHILSAKSNFIEKVDLYDNLQLEFFELGNNRLRAVDLSLNTKLERVYLWLNDLTALDVSGLTQLRLLNASLNRLTEIDVSKNVNLTYLDVSYNMLAELDLKNNKLIRELHTQRNDSLFIIYREYPTPEGYNDHDYQRMVAFFLQGDNLAAMQAVFEDFDLANPRTWANRNPEFHGVNYVPGVWWSRMGDDPMLRVTEFLLDGFGLVGDLDLRGLDELQVLDVPNNHLITLNAFDLPKLRSLAAHDNMLSEVYLPGNDVLRFVNLGSNRLMSVDLSHNTRLETIYLWNNQLSEVDVSHLTQLKLFQANGNRLEEMNFSANPLLEFVTMEWNRFTDMSFLVGLPNLLCVNIKNNRIDPNDEHTRAVINEIRAIIEANINKTEYINRFCCDYDEWGFYY